MNREIKFKAIRKDGKGWVYGYFYKIKDKTYILDYTYESEGFGILNVIVEVIPETVCQFTGLLDKNGKEIYEGDNLKPEDEETENIVRWDNDLSRFVIDIYGYNYHIGEGSQEVWDSEPSLCDTYYLGECEELEVIGSIHEGKETKGNG
ncbi:YopX family protein [Sphingobacterium spiritivorum]|uniref:YopX family protein n=1 Tax=Sphingobacterium spiritivorum TaxID=258 RepID=UPI003DA4FB50